MSTNIISLWIESFPKILLPGLLYTIPLTLVSFAIGLLIAIVTAIARVRKVKIFSEIIRFYVWVFRGTPLLVQLYIIFFGLPNIGVSINAIPASIVAFSLNVGAYASETVRASIEAVPQGQKEACMSVGMTTVQSYVHVILPQAMKISVPPLFNSFISLVKDTSLAANITVSEMFMVTQGIAARTYQPLAMYIEVAFIYLIFCTILSQVQKVIEKKMH
ncbi:MAG: amino acid ABC transporter permease [Eubacterium sp.]